MLLLPAAGGCNCGATRYLVSRQPLTAYLCHCHLCQKRTGSAFSMSLVVPVEGFHITQGAPARTERRLANGRRNTVVVCAACHARLATEREARPTLTVRAGTLDDTSAMRPAAQIWTDSAQPWAVVPGILSYAEQPADFEAAFNAWAAAPGRD